MKKRKIGDQVAWYSSSAGSRTYKVGRVVAVVPEGTRPGAGFGLDAPGGPRDHESYVVAVKVGKTDRAKPKHYWPRASALVSVGRDGEANWNE